MSLHDTDDLFVPFSREQIYAQHVADHGQSSLFVSRAKPVTAYPVTVDPPVVTGGDPFKARTVPAVDADTRSHVALGDRLTALSHSSAGPPRCP